MILEFQNSRTKIEYFSYGMLLKNTHKTFELRSSTCPNVSTTPIMAMGCRQCLPLCVVQLKAKHCLKPHCRNGVVDTFGPCRLTGFFWLLNHVIYLKLTKFV